MGLTDLQRLYISRCKLSKLDDTAFKGLSNLVELDLTHNDLNMVPSHALHHVPLLMRLQMSHNPITNLTDGAFKGKNVIIYSITFIVLFFVGRSYV